jgi:hypothetical protein
LQIVVMNEREESNLEPRVDADSPREGPPGRAAKPKTA